MTTSNIGIKILSNCKIHFKDNENFYHREDGPAVEYDDGSKLYYKNDKLHREGGPACEWINGNKFWYKNDKLHREDGPAIEEVSGFNAWYINGKNMNCSTQEHFLKLKKTLGIK